MAKDLSSYLKDLEANYPEAILRIKKLMNVKYEITALQKKLDSLHKYPVLPHNYMESGPYIGTGFVTAYDPDIVSIMVACNGLGAKKKKTGVWPAVVSHTFSNMNNFWGRSEDMPVCGWKCVLNVRSCIILTDCFTSRATII